MSERSGAQDPGRGWRLARLPDPAALARAAAEEVAVRAGRVVAERGAFSLALSGGTTPRALYALLADEAGPWRARIPWQRVHVFFGDERDVPPDHVDSNYRMAREALLDRVPLGSVHRIEGELPGAEAAQRYQADLRAHFGPADFPVLDLVLLGLGADGHTASLFPGSPALEERRRWVVAGPGPAPGPERISLTFPVLERARALLFLVAGRDKAGPLAQLLAARPSAPVIPAARIRPGGDALVLADEAAGAALPAG